MCIFNDVSRISCNDNNKDDEEINNNERIIDDNIIPPAISNESRPRRNAVRPRRYRGTPPHQNIEANIEKMLMQFNPTSPIT